MEHNFVVFALAGEFFKGLNGFDGYTELIDDLMETQRKHFTLYGLYRDPNDPITYDLVVRQQLDLIRSYGYSGRNMDWLKEVSRRGALTALLYQSSTGQAPFGGRSNQFHFVEAHFACMCESQARFYKEAGDMVMAEVFKRAGRRAVALTLPWIMDMEPFHHMKQGFHPSLEHGVDSGGFYSIYGILMASLCGTAYHLADESIGERITPAEHGGYVFELWPAHHKVFATCGGYHAEIDTRADLQKDSTGLGRIHRRGVWPETALSASIASGASYTFGVERPLKNLALGPAWRDADGKEHRLADFGSEIEDVTLSISKETQEAVFFAVRYSGKMGGCREIVESYRITSGGIDYSVRLDPQPPEQSILVPVILSDGEKEAAISEADTGLEVTYRGAEYRIRIRVGKECKITDDPPSGNRNAFYRTLEIRDNRASLELTPLG
jgi:hypothetical protein